MEMSRRPNRPPRENKYRDKLYRYRFKSSDSVEPYEVDVREEFVPDADVVGAASWKKTGGSELQHLMDLFPHLDRDLLFGIFQTHHRDIHRSAAFVLANFCPAENVPSSPLPHVLEKIPAPFCRDCMSPLPHDAILVICDYLNVFELCMLARTNRSLRRAVEEKTNTVSTLDFSVSPFRTWNDAKMLSVIRQFPNLTVLSLRNCLHFSHFQALSSCASQVTRLNLDGCEVGAFG